ncbi:MAG: hypothetical protein E6Q97_37525 [Desulfurellales bacterium]|nr:MAG: hypothetical protein E6Q97_37525 [Desulfurellales bacterium]
MAAVNIVTASGGTISQTPSGTIQAAIDALPRVLNHAVTINIGAGAIAGFTVAGFTGSGSITFVGTMATVTPTTGSASGTAAASTSSTILKGSSWTVNDFQDKFLSNTTRSTVRPIKSNTATDIITHTIASQASGDSFAVVSPSSDVGDIVVSGCKVAVTLQNLDINSLTCDDNRHLTVTRCLFQNSDADGSVYSQDDRRLTITDCVFKSDADVVTDGTDRVTVHTSVVHVGQVSVSLAKKLSTEIYANACTASALVMDGCLYSELDFEAVSSTATPLVISDCPSVTTRNNGLVGSSNSGAPYGIDVSGNSHVNIGSYNTLSGGTGDVICDGMTGAAVTMYANIAASGGTLVGDRASIVYGSAYGTITKKYIESAGDIRAVTTLFYGFEGWTYSAVTAFAGGGQASATLVGATMTDVTVCASAGDSIKLYPDYSAAGRRMLIRNSTANAVNIFPGTGGQINSLGVNNAYSLAAGYSVWIVSTSGTTFKTYGLSVNA